MNQSVMRMSKVDFKKEMKDLYNPPSKEIVIVNVPLMNFLMVDGSGNPNTSQQYQEAIEALYAMSYALKFMIKKGKQAIDYCVMPLEGLWWIDDGFLLSMEDKDSWKWTSIIMQPHLVTEALFKEALEQVKKKQLAALLKVRFESYNEGLSAQIMHLGPYSSEKPTVERLHAFIEEENYVTSGKHHEIYLSDPRKSAPEKMKTIIRQPIKKKQ
jgi:hypothetical protein